MHREDIALAFGLIDTVDQAGFIKSDILICDVSKLTAREDQFQFFLDRGKFVLFDHRSCQAVRAGEQQSADTAYDSQKEHFIYGRVFVQILHILCPPSFPPRLAEQRLPWPAVTRLSGTRRLWRRLSDQVSGRHIWQVLLPPLPHHRHLPCH